MSAWFTLLTLSTLVHFWIYLMFLNNDIFLINSPDYYLNVNREKADDE